MWLVAGGEYELELEYRELGELDMTGGGGLLSYWSRLADHEWEETDSRVWSLDSTGCGSAD